MFKQTKNKHTIQPKILIVRITKRLGRWALDTYCSKLNKTSHLFVFRERRKNCQQNKAKYPHSFFFFFLSLECMSNCIIGVIKMNERCYSGLVGKSLLCVCVCVCLCARACVCKCVCVSSGHAQPNGWNQTIRIKFLLIIHLLVRIWVHLSPHISPYLILHQTLPICTRPKRRWECWLMTSRQLSDITAFQNIESAIE